MAKTNSKKENIIEEIKKLEIFLHHPDFGTGKEVLENMMDENFWEVGASGKRYNKKIVLKVLLERAGNPNKEKWNVKDFECIELSESIFLVTYKLTQDDGRVTRRSSIWKKIEQNWKIVYHQGTIV